MFYNSSRVLFFFVIIFNAIFASAEAKNEELSINNEVIIEVAKLLKNECALENHCFFGLASYLDTIRYNLFKNNEMFDIREYQDLQLSASDQLVAADRFNSFVLSGFEGRIQFVDNKLILNSNSKEPEKYSLVLVPKKNLKSVDIIFEETKYAQLWWPLTFLAKIVESTLIKIQLLGGFSWGVVIIVFTVFIKILMLPMSLLTTRIQNKTIRIQSELAPKLAEIKQKYKGEDAHNRIMAAHKELGVTPFYSLKPSLGFFIQMPIFIAIFNALGEMPQFVRQEFLWIKDLAYPDAVFSLGFTIPLLGNTFNLTPFLMAVVAIVAALTYKLEHVDQATLKAKRKQLVYVGLLFLILFFPFPAAMAFYWFLANVLHLLEQNIRSLKKSPLSY
jgi:YidC/Oxa1 family membrane protein insertase